MRRLSLALGALLTIAACAEPRVTAPTVDWLTDRIVSFADELPAVIGEPTPVESPYGRALYFDGVDDALLIDSHPLRGASEFTIEMLFRPDTGGAAEQRVLHLQQDGSSDRILLETRLVGDRWFMDSYVKSDGEGYTLFAREYLHPLDRWFHVALVVGGGSMTQFVDGRRELSRGIDFVSAGAGHTSLGVRINRVDWFRGAVRRVRFTPRALSPAEFFRRAPETVASADGR